MELEWVDVSLRQKQTQTVYSYQRREMFIVILCVSLVLTVFIGRHRGARRLTRGFLVSTGEKLTHTTTTGIMDGRCGECWIQMLKFEGSLGKFGGVHIL